MRMGQAMGMTIRGQGERDLEGLHSVLVSNMFYVSG